MKDNSKEDNSNFFVLVDDELERLADEAFKEIQKEEEVNSNEKPSQSEIDQLGMIQISHYPSQDKTEIVTCEEELKPLEFKPLEKCQFCGSMSNLEDALRRVDHFICRPCVNLRKDSHNYRLISQTNALQKYGLTLRDLKDYDAGKTMIADPPITFESLSKLEVEINQSSPQILRGNCNSYEHRLALKPVPNPRGYGNPMKLYYLFQILEICVAKYGSIEATHKRVEHIQEKKFSQSIGLISPDFNPKPTSRSKKTRRLTEGEKNSSTSTDAEQLLSIPRDFWCSLANTTIEGDALPKIRQPQKRGSKQAAGRSNKRQRVYTSGSSPVESLEKNTCTIHRFGDTFEADGQFSRTCQNCHFIEQWEEI